MRAFMEKFRMDRDEAERATRSAIGMGISSPLIGQTKTTSGLMPTTPHEWRLVSKAPVTSD